MVTHTGISAYIGNVVHITYAALRLVHIMKKHLSLWYMYIIYRLNDYISLSLNFVLIRSPIAKNFCLHLHMHTAWKGSQDPTLLYNSAQWQSCPHTHSCISLEGHFWVLGSFIYVHSFDLYAQSKVHYNLFILHKSISVLYLLG